MCVIDQTVIRDKRDLWELQVELPPSLEYPYHQWNYPMRNRLIVGQDAAGVRKIREANWGLIPFWAKDRKIGRNSYNARADSLAQGKPMFREAFVKRRCLLLGRSYIEYDMSTGKGVPFEFFLADERPYAYAGLFEAWGATRELSCTMVTTEPNELVAPIKDRMPVILRPEECAVWLDANSEPGDLLALLNPFPADLMAKRQVESSYFRA